MKTDVPSVIQTLSSRACTYARKDASRSSCQPAGCTSKQRRFCMLCVHCPNCVDNAHDVSCDLCDACSACSLQTSSS